MLTTYRDLIHLPVAAVLEQKRAGLVSEVVSDPAKHSLVAFLVRVSPWPWHQPRALSPHEVVEYDPHGLVINDVTALVHPWKIVRLQELGRQRGGGVIGRGVATDQGRWLGAVSDYTIETDTGGVTQYYVRNIFADERVIAPKQIVRVTPNRFIVSEAAAEYETAPTLARSAPDPSTTS